MCILAKHPVVHQLFAISPRLAGLRVELDPDPQASPANLLDLVAFQRSQLSEQVFAKLCGVVLILVGLENLDDLSRDRASQRIAAERAAVIADSPPRICRMIRSRACR